MFIGCQHKLQNESGTISATTFPDYQYCSWSIIVNQGHAVSLTFTSINIPGCDGNYMNIYDGVDDVAPIIMSLCGKNATSRIRLRSTGNKMFITLRSGQNSQNGENMQFQANFTTTAPFSGMCIFLFHILTSAVIICNFKSISYTVRHLVSNRKSTKRTCLLIDDYAP